MVSLSNNWSIKRDRKSGDWHFIHPDRYGKGKSKESISMSNKAAILLAEYIMREQDKPTARKKMQKLERNQAPPKESASEYSGQEWLDKVRPDVIDFTHALILAKEAGLRISSVDTDKFLTPHEAGKLNPKEVLLKC